MPRQKSTGTGSGLRAVVVLAVAATLLAGCIPGKKLLNLEVYQGSLLILRNSFDAPDSEGTTELWRRTGERPFAADEQVKPLTPDPNDPLRITISGTVRIQIVHGTSLESEISLDGLTLIRETEESELWYLAPAEVQRAMGAAER